MIEVIRSKVSRGLLAIGLAAMILGGCTGGNIAGPQPEKADQKVVKANDGAQDGNATTKNNDGTGGTAPHNTSPED